MTAASLGVNVARDGETYDSEWFQVAVFWRNGRCPRAAQKSDDLFLEGIVS